MLPPIKIPPAPLQRSLLIVLLGLASAVVLALLGAEILSSRRDALQDAATRTYNYAAIIEARLDAMLRRTDAILLAAAEETPAAAMSLQAVPRHSKEVTADLDRDLVNFGELIGMRIFDAAGELLYSSSVEWTPSANIADRPHFRRLRDDAAAGVVFSEVINIASAGRQVLTASRALRDPQGRFLGVALAVIDLRRFQRLFESLDVGRSGMVAIRRSDDFADVLRRPLIESEINRPLPPGNPLREAMQAGRRNGTLVYQATSDEVLRTFSWRSVEHYPFFVQVGAAHADVLAGWRTRSLAVGSAGAVLLLLIAGLLARLWRMAASEARAVAELNTLNAELESRVERRTAELVAARDEAQRASQAKSEFLSGMSHELRTPMNAILGFGQLLELDPDHSLPAKQKRYVDEIVRAGQHLLELINDLLDLARIEAGKQAVSLQSVDVAGVVGECLALVEPAAVEQGVELSAAMLTECECAVAADPLRLKQVLLNLLSNAIKYNRPAGRVSIGCRTEDDSVLISVVDTGPGLSSEQQERLFQSFERLEAARTGVKGAGIGLVLSKRLTEMMGGQIGMHSTLGMGSTFWVRLPLATPAAARADAPPRLPVPEPTAAPAGPIRTVLYVEDDPVNVVLMQAIFAAQRGCRLIAADQPQAGLECAHTERPDLILLDIQLPGMDGYEVLRRLRADPATRSIPVIAVSANATAADVEKGLAAGFKDYLTKPVDISHLLRSVGQALGTAPP